MKLDDVEARGLTDFSVLPAQGKWHPGVITTADAKTSKGGNPMIAVATTLESEGVEGYTLFDNFLTDGSTKGGGFGKKKLMGCGVDVTKEMPDEQVAESLLGKQIFVKVRHEIVKDEDPPGSGKYTKARYETNDKGEQIPVKRAVPLEYSIYNPDGEKKETAPSASAPAKETKATAEAPAATEKPSPPWVKAAKKA